MDFKHEKTAKGGKFYLQENGTQIGNLVYVFAGDTKIIIEHTEVNNDQEGKGLGKKLVIAAVDFARENGFKILPLCPYARRVLEKSDFYTEVLF